MKGMWKIVLPVAVIGLALSACEKKTDEAPAEAVAEDFPLWDGGGIPDEVEQAILDLERSGRIECYYDLINHCYEHKLGGYPSYCQSGIDVGDGFEFVMQIASDAKIGLNVVDGGKLMFWKHRDTGEWALYFDFY